MRAVTVSEHGGTPALIDLPNPQPGRGGQLEVTGRDLLVVDRWKCIRSEALRPVTEPTDAAQDSSFFAWWSIQHAR
jgi:hypothetical protein